MGILVEKTNLLSWEDLHVTVYLGEELEEELKEIFTKLVDSWYTLGTNGAYGGVLHSMSDVWIEETEMGFSVDMGSSESESLDILLCSIEGFAEVHDIIIEKIVLGIETGC